MQYGVILSDSHITMKPRISNEIIFLVHSLCDLLPHVRKTDRQLQHNPTYESISFKDKDYRFS